VPNIFIAIARHDEYFNLVSYFISIEHKVANSDGYFDSLIVSTRFLTIFILNILPRTLELILDRLNE
jgi:hypothetical protein